MTALEMDVESPVDQVSPQACLPEGLHVIAYRAMLDVPRELVAYVSKLLADHRRARGTRRRSRALTCWNQALFTLVWFRKREDLTLLGAGFGISRATAYRYHAEAITVLADKAPDLHEALDRVAAEGWAFVILDGKVFACDRYLVKTVNKKGKQIDLWYAGKRHRFGGVVQAVTRPDGLPIWISDAEPGSVHDLTAAREHALGALYAAAAQGLPVLADAGYEGAGHGIHTPFKQPTNGIPLHSDNLTYNALLRSLRCIGERGFALLTQRWRALQHITASPTRITPITKAALVLTQFEHRYLPC